MSMTTVGIICLALLAISGVLALVRIARGPTMLDRTIATDVFIADTAGAIGIEAALNQHTTTLPILVALALIGFLGSVSVARFAAHDREENPA